MCGRCVGRQHPKVWGRFHAQNGLGKGGRFGVGGPVQAWLGEKQTRNVPTTNRW